MTRIRNEITALDLQKQGNSIRLEKLSAEKIQLEEERTKLEARMQEFAANVETERLNAQTKRGSVEQRQNRLREIQVELQESSAEQDQFLQAQAEKRSRLGMLEQLEGSREGFDAGAVAALRQSRSVIGSLADRIRVPEQFVVAIENALGHHLQLVLDRTAGIRAGNSCRFEREQNRAARALPRFRLKFLTTSSSCSAANCCPKKTRPRRKAV